MIFFIAPAGKFRQFGRGQSHQGAFTVAADIAAELQGRAGGTHFGHEGVAPGRWECRQTGQIGRQPVDEASIHEQALANSDTLIGFTGVIEVSIGRP